MHQPSPGPGSPRPRPFPKHVEPAAGESLASLIDRVAAEHQAPLNTVLAHLGLDLTGSGGVAHYGARLDPAQHQHLQTGLGVTAEQISRSLLTWYEGTLLDHATLFVPELPAGTRNTGIPWASVRASRACPDCLAEQPAWPTRWKLGTSAVCTRHRRLLADVCPACDQRLRQGDQGRTSPNFPRLVPEPGHCDNTAAFTASGRRVPCGFPLEHVDTGPPLDDIPRLVAAQEQIDAAVERRPMLLEGRIVSAHEWLTELRGLCSLALYAADTGDFGDDLPPAALEAIDRHNHARDTLRHKGAGAPRYTTPPATAALAANVLDLAVTCLASEHYPEAVDWLVGKARDRDPSRWVNAADLLGLSDRLRRTVEEAAKPAVRFTRIASWSSVGARPYRFGGENLPHLISLDLYRLTFARHLPGTFDATGRHFVALALCKVAENCTWEQAAVALEADPRRAARTVDVCTRRVPDPVEFWTDVHEQADLMDYGIVFDFSGMRWRHRNLTDLDDTAWKRICREAGIHPGREGGRRRYAAAWLWSQLTGGDPRWAPALLAHIADDTRRTKNVRAVYSRFVSSLTPETQSLLLAHARELTEGDRR